MVGSYVEGASARIANSIIWRTLRISDSARDSTCAVDFWRCEVDFAVTEAVFLEWCADNNWETVPIDAVDWYLKPAREHHVCGRGLLVGSGYYFKFPEGNGIFDAGRGRANFRADRFR